MRKKINVGYDPEYDVLYVGIRNMENSYGDEEPNNFVTHRDMDTRELTGFTILDFKKFCESGEIKNLPFGEISYEEEILPLAKKECDFL